MVGLVGTILVTIFVVVMILLFERRRAEGIRRDLQGDLRADRERARESEDRRPEDPSP